MSYPRKRGFYNNNNRNNNFNYAEVKAVDVAIADVTFGLGNPVVGPNAIPGVSPTSGAVVYPINVVNSGTGSFQRIGISLLPKSIRIRGSIAPIKSTAFPGPFVRMALVYDRTPSANLPLYEDIFQGFDAAGTAVNGGSVSPNPSNTARFTIIRDVQMQLGYVSSLNGVVYSVSPAQIGEDKYVSLFNKKTGQPFEVQYKSKDNTGTWRDISTGAFYYVLYNTAETGTLGATFTLRFSYTDS